MHYLKNQLHSNLVEEEDGPDMLIENDGWEEEVEPVDEDDVISDLDSEHTDQSTLGEATLCRRHHRHGCGAPPCLSSPMDGPN